MKTIKVCNNCWLSREQVGCNIHGYIKSEGSTWAGRATGMILEGYDWELAEIMRNEKSLIKRIEEAVEVLKTVVSVCRPGTADHR